MRWGRAWLEICEEWSPEVRRLSSFWSLIWWTFGWLLYALKGKVRQKN